MKRKVVRAVRSPMNASRWCVDLSCGHECWTTSRSVPKEADCLRVECNTADAQVKPRQKRLAKNKRRAA